MWLMGDMADASGAVSEAPFCQHSTSPKSFYTDHLQGFCWNIDGANGL